MLRYKKVQENSDSSDEEKEEEDGDHSEISDEDFDFVAAERYNAIASRYEEGNDHMKWSKDRINMLQEEFRRHEEQERVKTTKKEKLCSY